MQGTELLAIVSLPRLAVKTVGSSRRVDDTASSGMHGLRVVLLLTLHDR